MKKALYIGFFALLLLPTLSFASFDYSVKYLSRGPAVIEVQKFLEDQGFYSGKIDGKFGRDTTQAVINWQKFNNLKVDGYFGVASRTKAKELTAPATGSEGLETIEGSVNSVSTPETTQEDNFPIPTVRTHVNDEPTLEFLQDNCLQNLDGSYRDSKGNYRCGGNEASA